MGANSVSPFFTVTSALAGQTLTFELTVDDGKLASDPDSVTIAIDETPPPPNTPPTVQVGSDCTEGIAPLVVSFNGSATDSDGIVTGCVWNFGDGQSTTVEKPSHTYAGPGTFTAVFTATDDDGATASAAMQIVVAAPPVNTPPTVSITANPGSGEAPVSVNFTASAADSDGTIASYNWQFGDGATSQTGNSSHTYAEAGSYNAVLTVTDNDGATATAGKTIVVSAPPKNTPPSVAVSADPTTGPAPLAVNFRCSASDSDGRIASYLWNFGDGGTSQSAQAVHQYKAKGDYSASVTVTDDQGAQTTRTVTIQAQETSADQDTDLDGLTDAQETANGLDPNSSDTDGDGLSDFTEWGAAEAPADTDADGTIDGLDSDSDNDGGRRRCGKLC
jgi:PKD repeat protein